jgi:hypothetical protein
LDLRTIEGEGWRCRIGFTDVGFTASLSDLIKYTSKAPPISRMRIFSQEGGALQMFGQLFWILVLYLP